MMLHVHVSVSFAKYGTRTVLTIFGHKREESMRFVGATGVFGNALLVRFVL